MNNNVSLTCVAAALLLASLPAAAAPPAPSWYIAPEAIYMWADRDRLADDEIGGQIAFGRSFSDKWDAELAYSRVSTDALGNSGLDIDSVFLNLHRVFYRDSRISPFLKLGYGYVDADYGGGALAGEKVESWTLAYGLGLLANLKVDTAQGTALALRAEIYGLYSTETAPPNRDHLNDTVAGIGLQYQWGAPVVVPVAAPVIGDSDGDGVNDDLDRCPGTPSGTPVDARGCELDSDGDGVVDRLDKCPGTPAGAKVDANGCELDGDGDGVVDRIDQCPNTRAGEKVDEVGCSFALRLEVYFDTASAEIKPESFRDLDLAVSLMQRNQTVRGTIEGHTDDRGTEAYNLELSKRRAASVRQYLIDKGVAASRLESVGYGESRPEADNATAEGRAQNRRVVLVRSDR
ncbi:MAG TPA: OmpA family protein [Steroidobacteraceae bacterium]|jgi:OOP family OmpA-OmpF porin|nr:OmpA family protein [Steroidobacteraceae bacterium]HNS28179.1 OmpA family protein [Steroidobacteraceae bacterium]